MRDSCKTLQIGNILQYKTILEDNKIDNDGSLFDDLDILSQDRTINAKIDLREYLDNKINVVDEDSLDGTVQHSVEAPFEQQLIMRDGVVDESHDFQNDYSNNNAQAAKNNFKYLVSKFAKLPTSAVIKAKEIDRSRSNMSEQNPIDFDQESCSTQHDPRMMSPITNPSHFGAEYRDSIMNRNNSSVLL